jgi:HD-like signal output (HDOD) protein
MVKDRWLENMSDLANAVRTPHLLKHLPAFSPVAIKLMALVADENVSFREVARLFSLDPVLAGQVLQMANSGLYGRNTPVQSVLHAVAILGLKNISRIAILAALSHGLPRHPSPWMRNWWRHSIAAALIADHVGAVKLDLDFGYTGGLLHAIGQLPLFQYAPEEYAELVDAAHADGMDLMQCERKRFGADHAELAGLILAKWGVPRNLQQAVSECHIPDASEPLSATVWAGCWYAESMGFGRCGCVPAIGDSVPQHVEKPLDKYLLDVLSVEVNSIEHSFI